MKQQLRDAITSKQFDDAVKLLKETPECFSEMNKWNQNFIISESARKEAYKVLFTLMDEELVVIDLFELDDFTGSFLEQVLSNLPFYTQPITAYNFEQFSSEKPKKETLSFLEKCLPKIENIEETVGRTTVLEWAFTQFIPLEVIELLIANGCDINQYDNADNSLLHLNLPKFYIEFLVNKGLTIDHKNKGNRTPLQKAIDKGNLEMARVLLDNGANPQHKDQDGNSLFYVALYEKLDFELYDLLCEYSQPNFEEKNNFGNTLLFDYTRRLDAYSSKKALEYVAKLLEQGADMNTACVHYQTVYTPLSIAATKPFEVFEIFFNQLTDINAQDNNGDTILHQLCGINLNFETSKAKELYKKVKLVLKHNPDVNIRNNQDKLPLDLASDDDLKEKVVKLLI